MSFYVTLHENKSNICTLLDQPLNLNHGYKVALTDININSKPLINFGSITIQSKELHHFSSNINKLEVEIILEDNLSIEDFVKKINFILCHKIRFALWTILTRKTSLYDFVFNYHIPDKRINKIIYLHKNKIITKKFDGYKIIKVQGYMEKIFKIYNKKLGKNNIKYRPYFMYDYSPNYMISSEFSTKIQVLNYIYIQCSFIEAINYGSQKSNILSVLPVNYDKNNNMRLSVQFPMYINVKDTYINTINIQLYDKQQNYIDFSNHFTQILLSLHFKADKK